MSELEITTKTNSTLIICFGGMALKFGGILPFEFLTYLKANYLNCDLIFYIDTQQCHYHRGLKDITDSIDSTVEYINSKLQYNYEKIIFMGVSAGGYAAILFGSLCRNVSNVICFLPQTRLINPVDSTYINVKPFMKDHISYTIYADSTITDPCDLHSITHSTYLEDLSNVEIRIKPMLNVKTLRDTGEIKKLLDKLII